MRGLALPPVTLVLSPLAVSPRVEDVIAFAFLFLSLSLNPDFYSPSSPPPGGRQRPTRLSPSLPGPGSPFPAPQIDSPSGKSGAQWGAAGAAGSAGGERLAATGGQSTAEGGGRLPVAHRPTESRKVGRTALFAFGASKQGCNLAHITHQWLIRNCIQWM